MKRLAMLLLSLGCASAGPSGDAHSAAVEAICASVRNTEGPHAHIAVNHQTEQLLNELSMEALRFRSAPTAAVDVAQDVEVLKRFRADHVPHAIRPPANGGCELSSVVDPPRDELFLQLSDPFVNPFVAGELGILGRLSFGGNPGATWFWAVLERRGERVSVTKLVELSIDDG
jgi:hypothetical protein